MMVAAFNPLSFVMRLRHSAFGARAGAVCTALADAEPIAGCELVGLTKQVGNSIRE